MRGGIREEDRQICLAADSMLAVHVMMAAELILTTPVLAPRNATR